MRWEGNTWQCTAIKWEESAAATYLVEGEVEAKWAKAAAAVDRGLHPTLATGPIDGNDAHFLNCQFSICLKFPPNSVYQSQRNSGKI